MTIGELKAILADMDDAGEVLARDRDLISLDMVDIVKHPNPGINTREIHYRASIEDVYGGRDVADYVKGQAIIFCDQD